MKNVEEKEVASQPFCDKKALKYEKNVVHEFDVQCKDIRNQLGEQLKCFADRTETQVAVLSELEDFMKKRGEIEAEYASKLEKLAKGMMQKQKLEKNKREGWSLHASCTAWQTIVDDTRAEAAHRNKYANLLSKHAIQSIATRSEDVQKMGKKCREMAALAHTELNRVLSELHTAMKTYQIVHGEAQAAEKKMRICEDEKHKCENSRGSRTTISRKQRNLTKVFTRRQAKWNEMNTRCAKARNEYILCVNAANAALHKFYADDLSSVVDCSDLGMDFWLRCLLGRVVTCRKELAVREMTSLADMQTLTDSLDSRADKQRFFESRPLVFMLPKLFEFRPRKGDDWSTVTAVDGLAVELDQRKKQIEKRLEGLRFESDEVWKTLEASEKQLFALYSQEENEDHVKWRSDLAVTFSYYLKKFEYFLLNGNLIERLTSRSTSIGSALGTVPPELAITANTRRKPKKCILNADRPRPKLFGSSLEEYVDLTGEEIPLIVVSTISFLSKYALRHQGLFRISGSASDISRFQKAFEAGVDLVSDLTDSSEANSVAGVLKLYLRELREPPFPLYLFDQFTDCVRCEQEYEFIERVGQLIIRLPPASIRLLRYLFGFLSHLCEYADENMMEPHNVAICLGPTLLPIPEGKDQVFYHNFVNELVRALIVHHEAVFPSVDVFPGPIYDRFAFVCQYADGEENETDDEETNGRQPEGNHSNSLSSRSSAHSVQLDTVRVSAPPDHTLPLDRVLSPDRPVWQIKDGQVLSTPVFSLRGQLHHARREEDNGVTTVKVRPVHQNKQHQVYPPIDARTTPITDELKRLFADQPLSDAPDLVRVSMVRGRVSPAKSPDQLSSVLSQLNEVS